MVSPAWQSSRFHPCPSGLSVVFFKRATNFPSVRKQHGTMWGPQSLYLLVELAPSNYGYLPTINPSEIVVRNQLDGLISFHPLQSEVRMDIPSWRTSDLRRLWNQASEAEEAEEAGRKSGGSHKHRALPSGKLRENYGKSPCFMGKSTWQFSIAIMMLNY